MRPNSDGLLKRRHLLLATLGLSLALAGCGKKGPLEPPPGSADAKKPAAAAPEAGIPSLKGNSKRPPPIRKPKEDFFLDPLL